MCRDAEVLSLFAAIINKLKDKMQKDVPAIFEAVFECTLTMITKNFEVSDVGSPLLGKVISVLNHRHKATDASPYILGFDARDDFQFYSLVCARLSLQLSK